MTHLILGVMLMTAQMPLHRIGPYVLVDGVRVNGAGPFRFLLDTGAQSCLISDEVARLAGITPAFRVELERSTGEVDIVPGAAASTLSIGSVERTGIEVLFGRALDNVRRLSPGIDGVIGQSFLVRLDSWLIDNHARTLTFETAPPPGGEMGSLTFEWQRPQVDWNGRRWILDSGAPRANTSHRLLPTVTFRQVYVNNRTKIVSLVK